MDLNSNEKTQAISSGDFIVPKGSKMGEAPVQDKPVDVPRALKKAQEKEELEAKKRNLTLD